MEDAGFACNLPGSGFVVARQHIDFDAGGLQFADGLYGALFYLICNPGYGKRVFTVGKPDDGLCFRCSRVASSCREGGMAIWFSSSSFRFPAR